MTQEETEKINLDDYSGCDCPVCNEEIAIDEIVSESHEGEGYSTLNRYFLRELKCPICNARWTERWLLESVHVV